MVLNCSKNYYDILEITVDSTNEEIKSAYRRLARKYHPDVNKNQEAIDKFKSIIEAYKILSNPKEREKYNILNGLFTTSTKEKTKEQKETNVKKSCKYSETRTNFAEKEKVAKEKVAKQNSKIKTRNRNDININIINSIGKFFNNIKNGAKRGDDITTDIKLTAEEAILGCKRVVHILTTRTCTKCMGKKFINGAKCDLCDGRGEISSRRKITVTIPKGVKCGTTLRIRGEGGKGINGGASGDLYLKITVESPEKIKIVKSDIYYNIGITPYEAALGEEITFKLFDNKIRLKLPPNTCSGQKFRIAKEGLDKDGDLIVTVSIEISKNLSDDEIMLYKKLKNLSSRKQ